MKTIYSSLVSAFCLLAAAVCMAQPAQPAQATAKADIWGTPPTASDDRFSNPKSKLYAGPDGHWNNGEVRASTGSKAYKFVGTFGLMSKQVIAVKDLQTLLFDFGTDTQPAPGVYKVTGKGNAAQKTVKLSFADVGNNQILEWSSGDGAGTLTVTLVNGFVYVTTRNIALRTLCITLARLWQSDRDGLQGVFLQPIARLLVRKTTQQTARARLSTDRRELCRGSLKPSGTHSKGETAKPMTLGFEGAMKLE